MMSAWKEVNILVTLDENYPPRLNVMLSSLTGFNPDCVFNIYLLHTSIRPDLRFGRFPLQHDGAALPDPRAL